MGCAVQFIDELLIRREVEARYLEEISGEAEGDILNALEKLGAAQAGDPSRQDSIRAARCILMYIGVPRGGHRDTEIVGGGSAQHSKVGRAGDVDYIRIKFAQCVHHAAVIAKDRQIEAKVLLKGKRDGSALQVETGHAAVLRNACLLARAHQQHRRLSAAGVSNEVTAGVGHAVDFVQRIGKESNTYRSCEHHAPSSCPEIWGILLAGRPP